MSKRTTESETKREQMRENKGKQNGLTREREPERGAVGEKQRDREGEIDIRTDQCK